MKLMQCDDPDDPDEAVPAKEKSRGSISMMTYVRYFKAGGHYLVLFCMLIVFIIAEVGQCGVKMIYYLNMIVIIQCICFVFVGQHCWSRLVDIRVVRASGASL